MNQEISLVITSISPANEVLLCFSQECSARNIRFIVVGDKKSPLDFSIVGCDFLPFGQQSELGFRLARSLPVNHYSRKNLGYLMAMRSGSEIIFETDDDNFPKAGFFDIKQVNRNVNMYHGTDWFNVYRYFSKEHLWPRGYPLERVMEPVPPPEYFHEEPALCPIHQGMADGAPDVDAIFRLTRPEQVVFGHHPDVAPGNNVWCPFNSQNTVWYKQAFMLMYLPSTCSFRMTDIWRSFIAQRIAWTCGWNILFRESTVIQQRNPHALMHDFKDEIPGYLNNFQIAESLSALKLDPGTPYMASNMLKGYEVFVSMGLMLPLELQMVSDWIADVSDELF